MTITVKRWIADQKRDELRKFNLSPIYKYSVNDDGSLYYADTEKDTVTMCVAEKLSETEKAVCVSLECETRVEMNGHDPVKVWFPKSQIIEMN